MYVICSKKIPKLAPSFLSHLCSWKTGLCAIIFLPTVKGFLPL